MQISTSVGVVQDILISLSFQKNAKLIADPSRPQDQPAGICVNCPAAELTRSSRASEANVPERAIAHQRKRADRRAKRGKPPPVFEGGHQATCPCLPGYSARLRGHAGNRTHTRPQSATCAERAIRLLSPPLLVVPHSASRVNSFAPHRVVSRRPTLFALPRRPCRHLAVLK